MPTANKIRVGAVNYLNTKPLIHGLEQLAPSVELRLDYPSRLADDLAAGRLDVALIPSIEFFQQPGYRIVSDACIGCRGPVLSVRLFFRVPPAEVRTLALDEGSRTSIALTRILLERRYGIAPHRENLPVGATLADTSADAVLLIGDRAIHAADASCREVWDLGDAWCRWSELPFVFAMWTARPDADLAGIDAALSAARDSGVEHLVEIADQEAAAVGLSPEACLAYLRDNLYFYLGTREVAGLELFYQQACQLDLAPPGVDLGLFDCKSAR